MSAPTVPAWAEVVEVIDAGDPDEYHRYASAEATVPGLIHSESPRTRPASVRLEHAYHPHRAPGDDDGPWYRPFVVLALATDSALETYLTPEVARRLASELTAAADRLEATVTAR